MTGRGLVLLAVLLAGCGTATTATTTGPTDGAASGTPTALQGEVLVSAAASLTDVFAQVEAAFEATHPDVDVVLNLGGSSALREQLLEGAPADVFAAANPDTMDDVVAAGLADDPAVFATNGLTIAVPAGNPAGVTGLEDFADDALLLGLCAPAVPCGDFARQALSAAGVDPVLDTEEPDVRALLTKVAAGELDAGITYVTDVAAAGDAVEAVAVPPAFDVVADYPIVVLDDAPNPTAATAFVGFVRSEDGQRILDDAGFGPP